MKRLMRTTALALILALLLAQAVCACADEDKAAEYLESWYGVAPFGEEVTIEDFNAALEALGQPRLDDEALTLESAARAAVRLAGREELALTYVNDDVPDKAADELESEDLSVDEASAPYVACAIDLGLIDPEEPLDGDAVTALLYAAAGMAGMGRRALGRLSDDDILPQINSALSGFINFDQPALTDLGTQIVLRGATTGYGLKYAGYDARFLEDYTIRYSHSERLHALQLAALLDSEGIDAWVQIEPKVSVYEYMPDWGDPGAPTPTYAVVQVADDRYLCYAMEYDMVLEFDDAEDKEAFHDVIETYAKKYDDSYDAEGNLTEKLIAGSWWQPLYSSATEMENEEFALLYDNVVYDADGLFSIHPFSLAEDTQAIADVAAEVAPELTPSPVAVYVNPAFLRYITGEDYQ